MKKSFRELNEFEIRDDINSSDLEGFLKETNYFFQQLIQGKLFFHQEKIKNIQKIAPILFGNSLTFYKDKMVQMYVDQYNGFNSMVSEDYSELFQAEREFSQQNIFTNKLLAHPMGIAKKCALFYNESTGSELMSKIGKLGLESLIINSKADIFYFSDSDAMNLLREAFKFPKNQDLGLINLLQDFIQNLENYPDKEQFNEKMNQIRVLANLKSSSLESFRKTPVEIIRNFLTGLQDTQSHIEFFCRYFHRLVHINKYGNNMYDQEYYNYNSKNFDEKEFRNMCRKELNDFPELQKFLRIYCKTFKKIRNVRSHQVTGEAKISAKGFIYIPPIENEKGMFIDYIEKREKMINYGVFINKIQLYTETPFEASEDVFVISG